MSRYKVYLEETEREICIKILEEALSKNEEQKFACYMDFIYAKFDDELKTLEEQGECLKRIMNNFKQASYVGERPPGRKKMEEHVFVEIYNCYKVERDISLREICKRYGISTKTFYQKVKEYKLKLRDEL